MIAITTEDGHLRIAAELPLPNAPKGQWAPARLGKPVELIENYWLAAETVDAGAAEIAVAECEAVPRKHNVRSGLVIDDHGAIR